MTTGPLISRSAIAEKPVTWRYTVTRHAKWEFTRAWNVTRSGKPICRSRRSQNFRCGVYS